MRLEAILTTLFVALVAVDVLKAAPQQKAVQTETPQNPQNQENLTPEQKQGEVIENTDSETVLESDSEDDGQTFNNGLPILIDIQYCNRTGLHESYKELEKQIYLTYPRHRNLEINAGQYPIPQLQQQLTQAMTYGQYALMAFLFMYKQIFSMFGISQVPATVEKILEKKMFILGGFMLLNTYMQNYLMTTNGFRVIVDSQVIFDGKGPVDVRQLLEGVKKAIVQM